MGRLEGKVAIITGAGTGIGEAIAQKFACEGAHLLINGLPDDPVEDVASMIRERYNGRVEVFMGDLGEEEQARACVDRAVSNLGQLDILINNAGVFPDMREVQELSLDVFDQLVHNNIRNAFLMTKYALPHLQRTRGVVISAGSEAGVNGLAQLAPYGGTKAFIHAFMKGVAVEQAKYGVRANCVCPGPTDTAWTHRETSPMDKEVEQTMVMGTPLARRGTPEEIANVYAFLASDEASFVTGALWLADGGITVAKGNVGEQVPKKLRKPPAGILQLEHSQEGRSNGS
jgi:NAD(P)-dependent dehydrogenase (short-subunit alcohol dehydrogenase family)